MKWLKNYVDIDAGIEEFCDAMTMSGNKVEKVEILGRDISKVVTGRIQSIEKHPDADKLVVTKVDVGEQELQIVTGAKNIQVGDIVPVALVGATLADNLKIKKGKLRGVESNGMMCSVEELGLRVADYSEAPEDGIYVFQQPMELGIDVKPFFNLDDVVVEYEITSNRADCFSVIGIAREAAATFNKPLKLPTGQFTPVANQDQFNFEVTIQNPELCHRFIGRMVKDIKIQQSPKWLKDRLRSAGIGPINNIVDITNYIMLEYGQPMHAYDLDLLTDRKIVVRTAKCGERIMTLDGEERELSEDMLVIADATKPIGIAGVIGGEQTKILDTTNNLFFEAAHFDGTSIRKTSKKLGLRTDASTKFEKHLDPNNTMQAMDRACQLIEELGAGKVVDFYIDQYPIKRQERTIGYDVKAINKLLGTKLEADEVANIFKRLELKVNPTDQTVTIPTWRADLTQNADLSEEVARLYGYDRIEETLATGTPTVGKKSKAQKIQDLTRNIMVALGINEAISYSFESPKAMDKLLIPEDHVLYQAIPIRNPLGEDYSLMRTNTVNGMLTSLALNYKRRNEKVCLFELGKTYLAKQLPLTDYPVEKEFLTIGMYGGGDFFDLKGVVEGYLRGIGLSDKISYHKQAPLPFLHPGRKGRIEYGQQELGYLGELHPDCLDQYEIGTRAYLAVLDIQKVTELSNLQHTYQPIPKYPEVNRDLALLVKQEIEVAELEAIIEQKAGNYLESIQLFDVYQGQQIETGYKSVAYALVYRASDRTLSEDEVNQSIDRILVELNDKLGATIRK